jgi:integrase
MLPSGSLRVKVYAGIDPLSGKRHYLTETIPAGPTAAVDAEKARTRLLNQVDERRNPRTKATVNQLMDRYLELLDVEPTTRKSYEDAIRIHIRPLLGTLSIGKLNGETLDAFHTILRRCRAHCDGDRSSSTPSAVHMSAPHIAGRTPAARSQRRQSGKFISASVAH